MKPDKTAIKKSRRQSRGRFPDGTPNPVDVYVGKRIKIRRSFLHLSQKNFANLLGITFQQVQKYEQGKSRVGSSRLWDISKILNTDINYYFEDMPEGVSQHSPRKLLNCGHNLFLPEKLPVRIEHTCEAQELLTYYFKIHNRELAEQILNLIKKLSRNPV